MANPLERYLDNLADAIRLKTGKTADIEAMDFATEIKSIPQNTTGIFQEKTVEITTANTTTVIPDNNYNGITKLIAVPKLQAKTLTVTSGTTSTVTPDTGYCGLSSVAITTNISKSFTYNVPFTEGDTTSTHNITIASEKTIAYIIMGLATGDDYAGYNVTGTNCTVALIDETHNVNDANGVNKRFSTYIYKITKNAGVTGTVKVVQNDSGVDFTCPVLIY